MFSRQLPEVPDSNLPASVWRQVATDIHNGTYVALVPSEELRVHAVTAWVQLW